MSETSVAIKHSCAECGCPVKNHYRYCRRCGAMLMAQPVTINIFNNHALRQVFIFYFVYLFICLAVKHTSYFTTYSQLFWVELLLAAITLLFWWLNRRQMLPVLRFHHFTFSRLLAILGLAIMASLAVNFSIREVNITFFESEVSYYEGYRPYRFPIALMIYSVAALPAVFEELAFRGIMYNYCRSFLDERLVVAVTAFLFALMHLTLISLVWLLPFAFFLGHLRRRYQTIWYGVAFHFAFNLTACVIDLYRHGYFTFF